MHKLGTNGTIQVIFSYESYKKNALSMLQRHQFQNECFLYSSCSIDPAALVSKTATYSARRNS